MDRIPILVSGVPGKMALEVVLAAQEDETLAGQLKVLDTALTGPEDGGTELGAGDMTLRLMSPEGRKKAVVPKGTVAVDFTQPDAALDNVHWYLEKGVPFVMGTTGYDRDEAVRLVARSETSALLAPNMGIPIVMIQMALEYLADRFPGVLSGYNVSITESHQSTKKDTSGTAKALVRDFARLGLPASTGEITQIRDPKVQREQMEVPEEHLGGHAYHFYEVSSPGGDVRLGLSHCIHGRRLYATGALQAAAFLAARVAGGSRGEVFTMTDVMTGMGG